MLKKRLKKINVNGIKEILIYTYLFGIIAHAYCYFNSNFSHDSLDSIYEESSEYMISIGRYIRPVYRLLRGSFTLPTLVGFLSLLFFGLSFYFILDSLKIKNKTFRILACGILVSNYSISTLNATYIHDADSYAITLLLVAFSVWLSLKENKLLILSSFLFFISLGIYQAYINVAVFVYLVIAFNGLVKGEDIKETFLLLIKRLSAIIFAMIMYYAIYLLVVKLLNIEISNDYNSIQSAINLSVSSILERINNTLYSEYKWFFLPHGRNLLIIEKCNIILTIIAIYLIIRQIIQNKLKIGSIVCLTIILLIIPFGINVTTLISNTYHDLTEYALFLSYVVILKIFDDQHYNSLVLFLKKATIVILSFMILNNCIYSNEIYLRKSLEYDATLSVMTRLIDRIEQIDGYLPGETKVAIIGDINNSEINLKREGFSKGTGLWFNYSTTYYDTYVKYLNYLLGYNINLVDEDTRNYLSNDLEIKEMPSFPNKSSVKMVNDILVVKLSD